MSTPVDCSIERIRAFARSKGWRKSRLAKEAGMVDTVLRDFDEPGWNPTVETLRRIEAIIPENFDPNAPASPSGEAAA